jgi:hypothetical protein
VFGGLAHQPPARDGFLAVRDERVVGGLGDRGDRHQRISVAAHDDARVGLLDKRALGPWQLPVFRRRLGCRTPEIEGENATWL